MLGRDKYKAKRKNEVMQYIQKMRHNTEKIGGRHAVRVMLSAPDRLSGLRSWRVESAGKNEIARKTKLSNKYANSVTRVTYRIVLTCGEAYISQTGRCVSKRLRGHCALINSQGTGRLAFHGR